MSKQSPSIPSSNSLQETAFNTSFEYTLLVAPDRYQDGQHGHEEPHLETIALIPSEFAEAQRDPAVLAIAPMFPVALVMPLSASTDASTWGVEAVGARETTATGSNVAVAVLDTGIDTAHPAFKGLNMDFRNYTSEDDGDDNGHGTHCAATIAGRAALDSAMGIAPGISELKVGKVLDRNGAGTSSAIFSAMFWAADSGAKIISMSLGLDFPGMVTRLVQSGWPVDISTSTALAAYRDNLRMFDSILDVIRSRQPFDGGAIVIAAAGNESRRNVDVRFSISGSLPSSSRGVVSVGAVGRDGLKHRVADFSNAQPTLVAPGVDILSARAGGGLATMSGTSMACPHVAGVAALWWEHLIAIGESPTAEKVTQSILNACSVSTLVDNEYLRGEGLVKAPNTSPR